jgi:hypothetical protein
MACCILIAVVMSVALAIKHRFPGTKADRGASALSWRLPPPER